MKAHTGYTKAGRQGLRKVVDYERRRFGMVRGSVADRIMTALEDTHAQPALADPALAKKLNEVAYHIFNGYAAGVALVAVDLVAMAREQDTNINRRAA